MAVALAIVAAMFAAASLRLPSLVSTLLAGYLVLALDMMLVTWALSPIQAVTATGLTVTEAALAAGAVTAWWLRDRPRPDLGPAVAAARAVGRDPVAVCFLVVAGLALAYELLLVLTVPPTNWDSLTYHLARVAAWHQHHGMFWIPNAPTARMNEFQPGAEQEIFFLFAATGSAAVFALPQFVGELAILVAVYGASRRLGFGVRASACSAALLATFSLVALEATTAQNDLVAASFPIVAACLLLGGGPVEAVLAGIALALGMGTKLTTVLALPVLVWLAWSGGRRTFKLAALGGAIGLLAAAIWSFVVNLSETGHVLGNGEGRTSHTVSLSFGGTIRTAAHIVDRLGDLSVLENWAIIPLAVAGVIGGAVIAVRARGEGASGRKVALRSAAVALPLLAPALVLGMTHIPAGDPPRIELSASEDFSAFGPIGTLALFVAPIATVIAVRRRDQRQLALALALPSYIVLLSLYAKYDIWITRFLIVPVVLTAPLFSRLFVSRAATAALLVVAALTVGLTLADNKTKPLGGALGRPWQLNQAQAIAEGPARQIAKSVAASIGAYERQVPDRACVGAVLDPDTFAYLLWGPGFHRRVTFLNSLTALKDAYARNLRYVVISNGANAPVAGQFTDAGWAVKPLGGYWLLATSPARVGAACA